MQQHTIDSHRAFFQEVIQAECSVWVCELDGDLLGFIAINQESIEQLYVRVKQQRRGIGSALLEHAKQNASRPPICACIPSKRTNQRVHFMSDTAFVPSNLASARHQRASQTWNITGLGNRALFSKPPV